MAKSVADPQTVAAKWARRLQQAGPDIQAGVEAVTVSPGILAAQQANVWLANLQASVGRWSDSMKNMQLDFWKNSMIQKGVSRITAGATSGQPKVQAFMQQWLQYESTVVANATQRGGLEQNIQRMVDVARGNAAAKGRFRQAGRSR